ncbi:unnamed protein product [Gordionus sp. m RMFG-2023]|uniref:probable phosphorylase b kinase regulatory subunit alpha n=1 Tax=Gordionus sp. m RMFG-2023 TaxID=3053472 RepID=UPI0030DDFD78
MEPNFCKPRAKLEYYERLLSETILKYQDPITSLIPSIPNTQDAWVRDNCFAVLAIWSLALAYKKVADKDEEKAKTYELEQNCIKLMRSLLVCFLKQRDKLEKFKYSQSTKDSFHAKFNAHTMNTIVQDFQWGHLQIDAISLYLLILAQMTASGLQLIFNLDEVSFIQNMVFYIEEAYRTADYGIWERGQKTNQGLPELNSSSIGMAKAALDSLNELDLFGAAGGNSSIIHCVAGESQQCEIVLESMLPRESNSKEVDSAILFLIGYPAFAIDSISLVKHTKQVIIEKLQGRYGFKRFLRDGYCTAIEDASRQYYEPYELKTFENIECEWPMFFALMKIDAVFQKNQERLEYYDGILEKVMIHRSDGVKIMPELYSVPLEKVPLEHQCPHSQDRVPKGKLPSLIGQSLYIISCLLMESYIAVGEIDPLNRRLNIEQRPELVVQVVVIAGDDHMKSELKELDIPVQTSQEIYPIEVHPSLVLTKIYSYLGVNKKLHLSGRPLNETFLLSTCKLYTLEERLLAFTSHYLDQSEFYMASDQDLYVDMFKMLLGMLSNSWKEVGRPTMLLHLQKASVDDNGKIYKSIITTLCKVKDGYLGGVRVQIGYLNDFLSTSCITNISWLTDNIEERKSSESHSLNHILGQAKITKPQLSPAIHKNSKMHWANMRRYTQFCKGLVKRTKSISLEQTNPDLLKVRAHLKDMKETAKKQVIPTTNTLSVEKESKTLDLSSLTHQVLHPSPSDTHYDHFTEWNKDVESSSYHKVDTNELIKMLVQTDSLNEQADIIHYLYITKGPEWVVNVEENNNITVLDLLQELYDKACHAKQWWLVRHAAGLLKKRVDNLSKIVTDLLVHQKQVTVGLPPEPREKIITHPLPPDKIRDLINDVYGGDSSTAMLTQELLVYLSIMIITEPNLFKEMLRLRTGLILQVMASELARVLDCSGEEASDYLLNLSPYEMKMILYNILSGREFNIGSTWVPEKDGTVSIKEPRNIDDFKMSMKKRISSRIGALTDAKDPNKVEIPLHGQWLRRRRLDGSLNRVPVNFYPNIWSILEKCHTLQVAGKLIDSNLTNEMTPEEMKFSLHIESIINLLPHPEYRQLIVEGLSSLIALTDAQLRVTFPNVIDMDKIVQKANQIFLNDQKKVDGDATLCCAGSKPLSCGGVEGICQIFYDSAPSGKYGTISYMCRSLAGIIKIELLDEKSQCHVN